MPVPDPPRFLNAFPDTLGVDGRGWWTANCPICDCDGMTIQADWEIGEWRFGCPDGCPHEEVVGWLQADMRINADQQEEWATRAWVTMMLAPTVEIWEQLLAGERVVESRLDQTWLKRFKAAGTI